MFGTLFVSFPMFVEQFSNAARGCCEKKKFVPRIVFSFSLCLILYQVTNQKPDVFFCLSPSIPALTVYYPTLSFIDLSLYLSFFGQFFFLSYLSLWDMKFSLFLSLSLVLNYID